MSNWTSSHRPAKCLRHYLGDPLIMLVLVQNKHTWTTVNQWTPPVNTGIF